MSVIENLLLFNRRTRLFERRRTPTSHNAVPTCEGPRPSPNGSEGSRRHCLSVFDPRRLLSVRNRVSRPPIADFSYTPVRTKGDHRYSRASGRPPTDVRNHREPKFSVGRAETGWECRGRRDTHRRKDREDTCE